MNTNKKVDEFLKKKKHTMTAEIQRLREIILSIDDQIEEDIKWSAPTFMYKGNMASFFMNTKNSVSLLFHYGARLGDKSGLLEGDGKVTRVARFANMKDIEKKKKKLESVVRQWMKMRDSNG